MTVQWTLSNSAKLCLIVFDANAQHSWEVVDIVLAVLKFWAVALGGCGHRFGGGNVVGCGLGTTGMIFSLRSVGMCWVGMLFGLYDFRWESFRGSWASFAEESCSAHANCLAGVRVCLMVRVCVMNHQLFSTLDADTLCTACGLRYAKGSLFTQLPMLHTYVRILPKTKAPACHSPAMIKMVASHHNLLQMLRHAP